MRFAFPSGFVLALAFAGAPSAVAQGVFSGIVSDPRGAPVPNVTIYITSVATNTQLEFATTADGRFEFSGLAEGVYRVSGVGATFTVTLAAFERLTRDIRLPFGPFTDGWDILPEPVLDAVRRGGRANADSSFRCSSRLLVRINAVYQPFCNLTFLVDEFEEGEQRRLAAPVLGPRIVRPPDQRLPMALLDAEIEGTVTLEARVGTDGQLKDLRVVTTSHSLLSDTALASAASAAWEPARIRGSAVEVPITLSLRFRLQPAQTVGPARPGPLQAITREGRHEGQAPAGTSPTTPAAAAFEVASVKPNKSDARLVRVQVLPGGRFVAVNQTLRGLIQYAYGVRDYQVTGPNWLSEDRFDIEARGYRQPAPSEMQQLVRTLLADRFRLSAHRETRVAPVYDLVVARDDGRLGVGLRPADPGSCGRPSPGQPLAVGAPGQLQTCGTIFRGDRISGRSVTLDQLAGSLSNQVGRPVSNRTGLNGAFDIDVMLTSRTEGSPGVPGAQPLTPLPAPEEPLALVTALREQLGLRLESTRGPVDMLVVDDVSRPTPD